jgi:HEAT repeat protein
MTVESWSERRALRVSGVSPEETMTDVETQTDPRALVAALADPARRLSAFAALVVLGPGAREAVRAGLGDGRWEVRRWCVYWFFRFAEASDVDSLVPLVRDPKSRVRQAALAVVALAPGSAEGSDVVPLLLERACDDESLRVRRQAVLFLAWERAHPDLESFFAGLLENESDTKLCRYARLGIARSRARAAKSAGVQPC